jgi:hypothetical protein
MANKLRTRRYKKIRLSSKKRRQSKSRTKRDKRKIKKTRKTRGGMKRRPPSTPPNQYVNNEEPFAPRKSNTRQMNEDGNNPIGVNLFQGFPGNQVAIVTPPQTPVYENNLLALGAVTPPRGNLNDAFNEAYRESITTPQDQIVSGLDYDEATISPLPAYRVPNDDNNNDDDDDDDEYSDEEWEQPQD